MTHSKLAAMTFYVMASLGVCGAVTPLSAQAVTGNRALVVVPPLMPPAGASPPPGMINGIGSGFGEQPNRNGTIRGAGADGYGVGRNPALHGGHGSGTGMVPKPVGQGE